MMKRLVLAVSVALTLVGCTVSSQAPMIASRTPGAPPAPPVVQACPGGFDLVAHVWSLQALPKDLQEEARRLIRLAESRDTQGATNPAGYRGDDVSRTLGPRLRQLNKGRSGVTVDLSLVYRDSLTGRVAGNSSVMMVVGGEGKLRLAGDPRKWILETIFPQDQGFVSPVKSDRERRLWLFPDEWGRWCTMNVHSLVP